MSRTYKTPPGHVPDDCRMRFDTKIVVVLRDDLAPWQCLNATAFLSSAITSAFPQLIGEDYLDADDTRYLAMLGQPVLVMQGDAAALRAAHTRALARDAPLAIFTADLFRTGNDDDNRAAVRAVSRDRLDVVGLAVHAPRNAVDKIVKGCIMYP